MASRQIGCRGRGAIAPAAVAVAVAVVWSGCQRGQHRQADLHPVCPAPVRVLAATGGTQPWEDDNCQPDGCGLNGAWLGEGFRFRTLRVTLHQPNEANLAIEAFTRGSEALTPDVIGDELIGRRGQADPLRAGALAGSVLSIHDRKNDRRYAFRIMGVSYKQFWTRCRPGATQCRERRYEVPFYKFQVTDGAGCRVQLCRPGMSEEDDAALSGTAVIFRGDIYKDAGYEVRTGDVLTAEEKDTFNIACVGTAISKLHMLRHTAASEDRYHQTTRAERQTMLRVLTADYCGAGYPFTEEGHAIDMAFRQAGWNAGPAYDVRDSISAEARWNEHGATCLATPRLSDQFPETRLRTRINRVCADHQHALPACPSTAAELAGGAPGQGNYAITGNPLPSN